SLGPAGEGLFQWAPPTANQRVNFDHLERNKDAIANQCRAILAKHAQQHGSDADGFLAKPLLVLSYEDELVGIHFNVPWESEHGCVILLNPSTAVQVG